MIHGVGQLCLGMLHQKEIAGSLDGGDTLSDGGVMLMAEAERKLGVIADFASVMTDWRGQSKVRHGVVWQISRLTATPQIPIGLVYGIEASWTRVGCQQRRQFAPFSR